MGSCMNKSSTSAKQPELSLPKQSEQSQTNQQNSDVQHKVQPGSKRLTVFHDQDGTSNQAELQNFIKQNSKSPQKVEKKESQSELQKKETTPVYQFNQQASTSGRRFSIQGAPARATQNSFEDKFVSLSGDIKEQPGQILQQMGIGISCKKGLKPESPNQDDFCVWVDGDTAIFGVFDGHGPYGHDVSSFAHKKLIENLITDSSYQKDLSVALKNAFLKTNQEVTSNSKNAVDCSLSGSTATVVVQRQEKLYAAHVGDSRATMGKKGSGKQVEAKDLTKDHKPTLKEEKKRIYNAGGEVKRMEGDVPHRVFLRGKPFPGLSMSRALGDTLAQSVGVIPEPEISVFNIQRDTDLFVLMCSDGVWEFISSKDASQIISSYGRARVSEATENLAQKAWGEWINNEGNTVDDITVICFWISE